MSESLHLTPEERSRLQDAFRQPEFRSLFHDFMRDYENPHHRQQYEQYLYEMEAEARKSGTQNPLHGRQIVKPEPQCCLRLKARTKVQKNQLQNIVQVYINVCTSENGVEQIKAERGQKGYTVKVPHLNGPEPRKFVNQSKNGNTNAKAYDFIINQSSWLKFQMTNVKNAILDTAVEMVKKRETDLEFEDNMKPFLLKNVKFKGGLPPILTISKKDSTQDELQSQGNVVSEPFAIDKSTSVTNNRTSPSFKITERFTRGMKLNFDGLTPTTVSALPDELVISVMLEKVLTIDGVELETAPKHVHLSFKQQIYDNLTIPLPYEIVCEKTQATFIKKTHNLKITLFVRPLAAQENQMMLPIHREEKNAPIDDDCSPSDANQACDGLQSQYEAVSSNKNDEFIVNASANVQQDDLKSSEQPELSSTINSDLSHADYPCAAEKSSEEDEGQIWLCAEEQHKKQLKIDEEKKETCSHAEHDQSLTSALEKDASSKNLHKKVSWSPEVVTPSVQQPLTLCTSDGDELAHASNERADTSLHDSHVCDSKPEKFSSITLNNDCTAEKTQADTNFSSDVLFDRTCLEEKSNSSEFTHASDNDQPVRNALLDSKECLPSLSSSLPCDATLMQNEASQLSDDASLLPSEATVSLPPVDVVEITSAMHNPLLAKINHCQLIANTENAVAPLYTRFVFEID